MDKIDKQILEILQENARTPLKSIAEQVFLSSPAVSSRIDHLEKQGIIKNYRARVDRHKLGYHITAFINLEMNPNQKPEFYPLRQKEMFLNVIVLLGNTVCFLKLLFLAQWI